MVMMGLEGILKMVMIFDDWIVFIGWIKVIFVVKLLVLFWMILFFVWLKKIILYRLFELFKLLLLFIN